jgi:hypothetical protein
LVLSGRYRCVPFLHFPDIVSRRVALPLRITKHYSLREPGEARIHQHQAVIVRSVIMARRKLSVQARLATPLKRKTSINTIFLGCHAPELDDSTRDVCACGKLCERNTQCPLHCGWCGAVSRLTTFSNPPLSIPIVSPLFAGTRKAKLTKFGEQVLARLVAKQILRNRVAVVC